MQSGRERKPIDKGGEMKETDAIDYLRGYQDGKEAGYGQSILDNDNWAKDTYGYKLGIREVVEWIQKHEVMSYAASPSGVHLVNIGMLDSWQSKMKEWGTEMSPKGG